MKLRPLACLSMVFLSLSCSDYPGQRDNTQSDKRQKSKPASSYSDTVTINAASAVFFNPDSLQLEKIKLITDTMIFESTVHDCFYQMRNARNSLKKNWPGIKIVELKNTRWIRFRVLEGKDEYIDLDTVNDPCGILLFDGHKKASLVDMMNIDTELGFYFSR